ncbi:MAG: CHASE2 domain-containing protein [Proteobacteria bacterium]|nr:CHASE2 domain-containing protein [Pseudomonadota bacterium]
MTFFKKMITLLQPYLIAILVTSLGVFAFFGKHTFIINQFMESISLKTIDLRFNIRKEIRTENHVVIAAIDEKSLKEEGKWPWPRSTMARLVTKASDAGVRVVAFDVGFIEDDDSRILETLTRLKKTIPSDDPTCLSYLDQLYLNADNDTLFAQSVTNSSAGVVLGYYFNLEEIPGMDETRDEQEERLDRIIGSQANMAASSEKAVKNAGFIQAMDVQPSIRILSESTDYSGFFNMRADIDGIVRSMPAIITLNDNHYVPLSLSAIRAWTQSPINLTIGEENHISIDIGDYHVPTDRNGRIIINYRGGPKTFSHISITDILHDRITPGILKDKILMVGATSPGLSDNRPTPFSTVFPGCEIHANLIDSILSRDLLYYPPLYELWSVLCIVLAGTVLAVCLPMLGALTGLILYVGLAIFYGGLCQYLFSKNGLILDMAYPLTVLTLVYITVTANRYLTETRKKKFISDAFSTYLAPSVVKQLIKSPEKLGLGGEDRDITAFFSDIQGFTGISEKLSPKELVELLNEFLTEMTNIILDHEGTVDKFEGDAIIAFFGAPLTLKNHAQNACKACITMHERLLILNEKWKAEQRPQLYMRIGLSSGTAVVGNMGSVNRMDYTMMGDVVNTAARLEGVNKIYGSYSMISDATRKMAGPSIVTREIDTIYLLGKHEPVTVYQIMGHQGRVNETLEKSMELYEKGLSCYKQKAFDKALSHFNSVLSLIPDDGPSKTMSGRCRDFITCPPDSSWNGVFKITSK